MPTALHRPAPDETSMRSSLRGLQLFALTPCVAATSASRWVRSSWSGAAEIEVELPAPESTSLRAMNPSTETPRTRCPVCGSALVRSLGHSLTSNDVDYFLPRCVTVCVPNRSRIAPTAGGSIRSGGGIDGQELTWHSQPAHRSACVAVRSCPHGRRSPTGRVARPLSSAVSKWSTGASSRHRQWLRTSRLIPNGAA
jgi:hypothetical protein